MTDSSADRAPAAPGAEDALLETRCRDVVALLGSITTGGAPEQTLASAIKRAAMWALTAIADNDAESYGGAAKRLLLLAARPAPPPSLDAVLSDVWEWARVTFPRQTPASVLAHLKREVAELEAAPDSGEEMADVLMALGSLARLQGFDLADAVAAKLEVCKARDWADPDADGVVEHVRSAPPPRPRQWSETPARCARSLAGRAADDALMAHCLAEHRGAFPYCRCFRAGFAAARPRREGSEAACGSAAPTPSVRGTRSAQGALPDGSGREGGG
jgi:hypothetical protein